MKFCKDCKWQEYGYCVAPLEKPDMVTGAIYARHNYCHHERTGSEEQGNCGPSAKLFAQIDPEELRKRERWSAIMLISTFIGILIAMVIAIIMFLK